MSDHNAMDAYRRVMGRVHTYTDEAMASRAAIAGLDAENERLQESADRYCDDCDRESYCAVLYAAYEEFSDLRDGGGDFNCNRHQPREGGEG